MSMWDISLIGQAKRSDAIDIIFDSNRNTCHQSVKSLHNPHVFWDYCYLSLDT